MVIYPDSVYIGLNQLLSFNQYVKFHKLFFNYILRL